MASEGNRGAAETFHALTPAAAIARVVLRTIRRGDILWLCVARDAVTDARGIADTLAASVPGRRLASEAVRVVAIDEGADFEPSFMDVVAWFGPSEPASDLMGALARFAASAGLGVGVTDRSASRLDQACGVVAHLDTVAKPSSIRAANLDLWQTVAIYVREIGARRSTSAGPFQVEPEDLAALGDRLRRRGRTVAWTNGCFDLLHFGHIRSFRFAKAHGDVLIVGLNTDDSVRRLKGPSLPVQTLALRVAVMAEIRLVDHVVAMNDADPVRLISLLRPDAVVKGAEYRDKTMPERDVVRAYGGVVQYAPMAPGLSSTALRTVHVPG